MTKRSVKIDGRVTSVSLEDQFYDYLKTYCERTQRSFSDLVREIGNDLEPGSNLSSALRVRALTEALAEARRG